ncbi:MAG: undecaprenyldiphospho-muramoylpentapeptide beta-N-acetylglucosaminyltransferase [Chloroflexi bacterium]|nr:undecaprenyldiphospho-muramoylpentapeptide beta-N-acetylglucosaminyltransferase [Chloroflexota bacterium]
MRLVVTGGGSGGHVYPALSVVASLRELAGDRLGPDDLLYVGMVQGMEYGLVRRAGLPFQGVSAGPVRGRTPPRLAVSGTRIVAGVAQAAALLRRFRAQAVLATGGYVCVPVVLGAWLQRIPTLVYLPDVEPGLAVRFLSRFARRIAVSVEQSRSALPAGKVTVTGYPVRPELFRLDRVQARQRFGLAPEGKLLLVLGGSQGSRSINEALRAVLPELLEACQIIHVCGQEDEAALRAARDTLPDGMRRRYLLYRYLHEDMPYALAAADLAVSRSGASVLGEYPAVGLPSVLVPYPHAGMHQRHNARALADAGAALILEERGLESLYAWVRRLLEDTETLQAMSVQARVLARPDAARRIAGMLLELAGEPVALRTVEASVARPEPVEEAG